MEHAGSSQLLVYCCEKWDIASNKAVEAEAEPTSVLHTHHQWQSLRPHDKSYPIDLPAMLKCISRPLSWRYSVSFPFISSKLSKLDFKADFWVD